MGNEKAGEQGVNKKKVHHLNPRRRQKLKQKLPEKPLTEEEKHRRAEQKKRRVGSSSSSSSSSPDMSKVVLPLYTVYQGPSHATGF